MRWPSAQRRVLGSSTSSASTPHPCCATSSSRSSSSACRCPGGGRRRGGRGASAAPSAPGDAHALRRPHRGAGPPGRRWRRLTAPDGRRHGRCRQDQAGARGRPPLPAPSGLRTVVRDGPERSGSSDHRRHRPADRAGGDGCRDGGGVRRRARRPAGLARAGQRRARARRDGALGHRTAAGRADADRDRHLTRAAGDPR